GCTAAPACARIPGRGQKNLCLAGGQCARTAPSLSGARGEEGASCLILAQEALSTNSVVYVLLRSICLSLTFSSYCCRTLRTNSGPPLGILPSGEYMAIWLLSAVTYRSLSPA